MSDESRIWKIAISTSFSELGMLISNFSQTGINPDVDFVHTAQGQGAAAP